MDFVQKVDKNAILPWGMVLQLRGKTWLLLHLVDETVFWE